MKTDLRLHIISGFILEEPEQTGPPIVTIDPKEKIGLYAAEDFKLLHGLKREPVDVPGHQGPVGIVFSENLLGLERKSPSGQGVDRLYRRRHLPRQLGKEPSLSRRSQDLRSWLEGSSHQVQEQPALFQDRRAPSTGREPAQAGHGRRSASADAPDQVTRSAGTQLSPCPATGGSAIARCPS
jgi:hypothetical protein